MICSYEPYEITSSLEAVSEFTFIDNELPRRIAVFSDCMETLSPPCADAVALHIEENCPGGCKVFWYECPSEMGRQYTVLPTPCGVKVTSFDDGLIAVENCDATLFGSELFCFGKVYTKLGTFESPDKSSTTFEFDGHTFTVKGKPGECNELYNCPECQISSNFVMAFEDLPTPPDDFSAPEPPDDDKIISDIDTPETEIIPAEGRIEWHWNTTTSAFGQNTICEIEKPLTSDQGTPLPPCSSNDNPAIATLPSGHTVVAYESRREDGIAKITVAVLSSSVKENIRSHRKLGTGTLLNNLVEAEGVATFIVYEDMNISVDQAGRPAAGEKIGFLTGPLAGSLFVVTKLTRFRNGDTIRHEFNFTVPLGTEFPDKNHIYDVNWFLVDNLGSEDLPSSENVTTVLDLPYHTDAGGKEVPVANPSIAVAQNNQMVSNEQNIYVAYQAFEDEEWRVYLREIILGTKPCNPDTDEDCDTPRGSLPTYISPYLFDENVRQIEIMAAPVLTTMGVTADITFYDEKFSGAGLSSGHDIDTTGRWASLTDSQIPDWFWFDEESGSGLSYLTRPFILCDGSRSEGATGLPETPCSGEGGATCSVAFNSQGCDDLGVDTSSNLLDHTRSFAISTIPTTISPGVNAAELSFRMRFHIIVNNTPTTGVGISEYPEIWFVIGRSDPLNVGFYEGFRIQIRRGQDLHFDSMAHTRFGQDNPQICDSGFCRQSDGCFIISLYQETSPRPGGGQYFLDRLASDGSQNDSPTRLRINCVAHGREGLPGDYSLTDWNELRVDTYVRGAYRFFDLYLKHQNGPEVLMTRFREKDESLIPFLSSPGPTFSRIELGPYHGFGVVQSYSPNQFNRSKHQVLIDSFSVQTVPRFSSDKIFFLEDYFDRDSTIDNWQNPDELMSGSPFMIDEPIQTNNEYDGANLHYCNAPAIADQFYQFTNTLPSSQDISVELGQGCQVLAPPKGWASHLRLRPNAFDRLSGNDVSGPGVSIVLSVNRLYRSHEGAYPHIWFIGRMETLASKWYSRYRLRISRFNCVSDYTSVDPRLTIGAKVWRLSAYNSGMGLSSDVPVVENFYIIGTDTELDWTEYASTGGGTSRESRSVWNYFRVDIYPEDFGTSLTPIVFDVYVGDDSSNFSDKHPDDINFQLLDSISVPAIPFGEDGSFFGVALFSGTIHENAEGLINLTSGIGDDYRSSAHLNYIAFSTIGAPGETTGACCRSTGGCTSDLFSVDCLAPDIWKAGVDCDLADCSDEFPIGAGCTSDGICHDGITLAEATTQQIPDAACTGGGGCQWELGKQCNPAFPDYRSCPPATSLGRCCRPFNRTCISDISFADCSLFFGNGTPSLSQQYELGERCSPGSEGQNSNDCPSWFGVGACCYSNTCYIMSEGQCVASNGTYLGERTDCVTPGCSLEGACCDGGDVCTSETQGDCLAAGSTFWGVGVNCIPDPCLASPDELGACCYDDGSCTDTLESGCPSSIGTWLYSTSCSDRPCLEITGACCDPSTGECEDNVSSFDCQNAGKIFWGESSLCAYVNCTQPTGACCIDLNCSGDKTLQECTALGGGYVGDFSSCITGICLGIDEDPYLAIAINYKPEDLWVIEVAPDQYVTRVLYHMQEEILVSSLQIGTSGNNNAVDFMFLIDHSASMVTAIDKVATAVPNLAANMSAKGLDVRFGFSMFGRGVSGIPNPPITSVCDCVIDTDMANGLQWVTRCQSGNPDQLEGEPTATDGFTRNVSYLQRALNCWGIHSGHTSAWSAMQFVLEDPQFVWRENAAKFIFFVTDIHSTEACSSCGIWSTSQSDAINSLINAGAILIPVVTLSPLADDDFLEVAEASGWTSGLLDINAEDYGDLFEQVVNSVDSVLRLDHATVIERATSGINATYLKKGEVIISYDGDLSDLWTFNKTDFEFHDNHVPYPGTNTKQLVNFPFALASGKIYGIDSVHIQGNPNNWVSFEKEGALLYSHPNVGHRASGISATPVLISANSAHPKVYVNNRNQIMVAYENYTTGAPQIEIKGTGDFHQNSITGPRANRIVRLLNQDDFVYRHTITLPGEGVNQLCDFVIDNSDITHVVWQSSRDGYWEIYYGNSFNMFDPVRITQADSRSSHPSINVDETGSVFVVYHDNRFGPFNIMLSSKDEERVIPLLEQDAYLASLRTGYTHYTNIIPVYLDNPSGKAPDRGRFWASKKADGAGNDSENFIYQINETTGIPSEGFDLASSGQEAIAFSSTTAWGIASDGVLSRLGQIGDNKEVFFSPIAVGTINLDLDEFSSAVILDMAVDNFDRIWVLIHEIEDSGGGSSFAITPSGLPMIRTFAVNHRLRLEYVSGFNAATIGRGIIKENEVDGPDGGSLTITSDDKFFITLENSPDITLSSSEYPDISEGIASFTFTDIGNLAPSFTPVSMTSDASDTLFSASSDNDLYTISKLTAGTTLQTTLTTASGTDLSLSVGTTASIAYQSLEVLTTGEEDFFHIRIDFYDNILFEGAAFLSVDSRENLEAFINEETLEDPYINVFGMDARGILLELDAVGLVFFDATHFVPGFARLSQPFSFEPNQTYFPRVFLISGDGNIRESGLSQPNSFSCTKCSRFGNNNFNSNACSYSFVIPNSGADTQSFNFQIDFYADVGKRYIIRRFEAIPGSEDLQYMEVDNMPATEQWTEFGLPIIAGDSAFIQIHPGLDPTAGFICGVTYTVQVNECHSSGKICSNFSKINPVNWFSSLVGGNNEVIDDQIKANEEVMLGVSMKLINNKLCVAWRTPEDNLKFAQLDETGWTSQVVIGETKVIYCDLAEINGLPSISAVLFSGVNSTEIVLTFDGSSWNTWANMTNFMAGLLVNPRSLLELDNVPMISFIGRDGLGRPTFTLNSGRSATWDTSSSCHSPFEITSGGSCTTTMTIINGLPSVAWIGGNQVRYGQWSVESENFVQLSVVNAGDGAVIAGKVALAEVDGQPAVAYLKAVGNLGQLKYKRFDGTDWIDISTNGQIRDFNKHIAMTVINGQPYIAYSVRISPTTSQLRYVFHNGVQFIDDLIEDDLNQVDHVVDIAEFNNEPAVIISANPFRVYFFHQQPSMSANEISTVFFCECASKIFTDRLTHLNEVARWESSAHGFADTPVTDSPKNSLRPRMKTRKTSAAIVIWEDYNKSNNCTDPPCIRAATFRNVNQDQLRGSGTKSWFDYDFGISGQDPDLALDLFERINAIYEKPKPPSAGGFHGSQISAAELPGNEIYGKVCDFSITAGEVPDSSDGNISVLENNVISFDQFISSQIVRKIRVKDEFVQYHTYNASGTLTPIVSTCNIVLEIHGTPEIVALRFRNENKVVWGPWCPWSPQISDFVMEKKHRISSGSGIKEVCIQAMTHVGITTDFCLPIVADYETIVFETKFYKNTDTEGKEITNFNIVSPDGFFPANLDKTLIALPLSEGISVASLDLRGGGTPCPEGSECEENEICIGGRCVAKTARILVEIITNQELDEEVINFNVAQQGTNDQKGQSHKGKNNDGKVLYRGDFIIEREDKVFNTDGLARVSPTFPTACEDAGSETASVSNIYTRDIFNEIREDITVEEIEVIDPLVDFRQTTSGRVGVSLDIRSSEDPYFVFGDPDYSLRKTDGQRSGVPFRTTETKSDLDGGG